MTMSDPGAYDAEGNVRRSRGEGRRTTLGRPSPTSPAFADRAQNVMSGSVAPTVPGRHIGELRRQASSREVEDLAAQMMEGEDRARYMTTNMLYDRAEALVLTPRQQAAARMADRQFGRA